MTDMERDIQKARDGLLNVEELLVRLVSSLQRSEEQNAVLERELLQTKAQRDSLDAQLREVRRALKLPDASASQGEDVRSLPVAPSSGGVGTSVLVPLPGVSVQTVGSGRACKDCGVELPKQVAGRPFKRCQRCNEAWRANYLKTRPSRRPRPEPPATPAVETPILREHSPVLDRYRREQEQKTATGAFDPAKAVQPERRCSKCCNKFRPKGPGIYFCDGCLAAKVAPKAIVSGGIELEVAWSGKGPLPGQEHRTGGGSQLAPNRVAGAGF